MTLSRWLTLPLFVGLVPFVYADGKAFRYRDLSGLRDLPQSEQVAAISFEDGIQRMLIRIRVSLDDNEDALWIFPVPGPPGRCSVDLADQFPRFLGRDPLQEARALTARFTWSLCATQVYPLPVLATLSREMRAGLTEYGVVEQWGLRVTAIGAPSPDALLAYVRQHHPGIESAQLRPFDDYCDPEHTLVVAWLTSREAFAEHFGDEPATSGTARQPTLAVTFPADRPFYPLKPTGAYGDNEMRILVYVMGHVRPLADAVLLEHVNTTHFVQDTRPDNAPAAFAELLPERDIAYTRVRIDAPANVLIDDLRFEPAAVPGLTYARALVSWLTGWPAILTGLLTLAVLSFASGAIAGALVWRRWLRPGTIALANCLTVLALIWVLVRVPPTWPQGAGHDSRAGSSRVWFLLGFHVLFMVVAAGVGQLLRLPLVIER